MKINQLVILVKKKIKEAVNLEQIFIEDKSFLHKNHKGHKEGKFHLKLFIKSDELSQLSKIVATKKIYSILRLELKEYIHSIQILFE